MKARDRIAGLDAKLGACGEKACGERIVGPEYARFDDALVQRNCAVEPLHVVVIDPRAQIRIGAAEFLAAFERLFAARFAIFHLRAEVPEGEQGKLALVHDERLVFGRDVERLGFLGGGGASGTGCRWGGGGLVWRGKPLILSGSRQPSVPCRLGLV